MLLDTLTRETAEVYSVAPGLIQNLKTIPDNRFITLSLQASLSDIWLASLAEEP